MIFYFHTYSNTHPIYMYLHSFWGRSLLTSIHPVMYENLNKMSSYPRGTYIFSDLESLTVELKQKAISIYHDLEKQPHTFLLNHPEKTLMRGRLLKRLHQEKINYFNVYRCTEDLSGLRFPVFVRKENDHKGPQTQMIHDQKSLASVFARLKQRNPRIDLNEWLICEFLDTADNDGIYRKYASFIIGDKVFPRHVFFSRYWLVKDRDIVEQKYLDEEYDYVRNNPHEKEIAGIFRLASTTYGRIDYSLYKGKIQVWEINTNPILLTRRMPLGEIRARVHKIFSRNAKQRWKDLDRQSPTPPFKRIKYALQTYRESIHYAANYKKLKYMKDMLNIKRRP